MSNSKLEIPGKPEKRALSAKLHGAAMLRSCGVAVGERVEAEEGMTE
jgi:hypothetical protein